MVNFLGNPIVQNATVTGPLEAIGAGMYRHAVQVVHTGASAFQISIKGSLDGVNFTQLQTLNANAAIAQITGFYRYIQINVDTLAGGESVDVTYVGL